MSSEWVTAEQAGRFGEHRPEDELLHGTGPAGDSLTETWYWGFHVPEAAINCFVYCWVHPNLDVVSAGLFIYRGLKRQHLAAELFDMRAFLAPDVVGDGSDIQLPNGLRMRVVEPLEDLHMTFADAARETRVDVRMTAVAPPVVRGNGKHFEQIMRTRGELVLRGERFAIDGHHIRDRSWGELRPEDHNPGPPYTWVTGVTEDGALAFNVGAQEGDFKDGWLWRDGRAIRLARASLVSEREPELLAPRRHVIEIEDGEGESLQISGEVVAGLPWGGWHNITSHLGLVRWDIDGRRGWGDTMDVQWNDYVWRNGQT